MPGIIEARLAGQGIKLPEAAAPAANYVPWVIQDGLLFVSGQLPIVDGKVAVTGVLGGGVSIEDGQKAARLCAINLLAQVLAATGDLDRVRQVVRLGGFVASTADFTDQSRVINGASDLMAEAFGDAGRHARAAVGVSALPLGAAVEVEGLFAFE